TIRTIGVVLQMNIGKLDNFEPGIRVEFQPGFVLSVESKKRKDDETESNIYFFHFAGLLYLKIACFLHLWLQKADDFGINYLRQFFMPFRDDFVYLFPGRKRHAVTMK